MRPVCSVMNQSVINQGKSENHAFGTRQGVSIPASGPMPIGALPKTK